ncbi:hypothetical protein [Castellaniella sp. MT123]|uniref:hypothetical protein n=1 Tax=Castellaniella sp. MT123 TaxID=3140381 RepID=UPI0031F40C14
MNDQKTSPSSQQQRKENIIDALYFIHQHGWLRPIEMGVHLWPQNAFPRAPGYALAKVLQEKRLVRGVVLPDKAGTALVLARRGAALLREDGIAGAQAQERWRPSSSWRHELIAAGTLATLYKYGWDVLPEAEIRRRVNLRDTLKLPDGLARDPEGRWWWIECEQARKSGPQLRRMASYVSAVGNGETEICGVRTTGTMIAYPHEARDEGGHRIDHRLRVTHAIETWAWGPVPIIWASCTMHGAGVQSIATEMETLHPDAARRVRRVLDARKWQPDESGVLVGTHPPHTAHVWHDEDYGPGWYANVEGPGIEPGELASYHPTISEAKWDAAQRIANARAKGKAA